MTRDPFPPRRSALLSFRFLAAATLGSLVMALVSAFGTLPSQVAVLGSFVSVLGGLFLAYLGQEDQRDRQRSAVVESLAVPLRLAADPELFRRYREISAGLTALIDATDPILRQVALLKLDSLADQMGKLADRKVVFALTESWRTVYDQLLQSPDIRHYRSVAWVRTPGYWRDEPGRKSMRSNYDAVRRGVLVERVVVLTDELWPRERGLPVSLITTWLREQHDRGVHVSVVRESELQYEPDLLADIGIYGDRAVGVQELDERCRTLRFTLDLNPQAVRLAVVRWDRLALYAKPFGSLLDRKSRSE